MKARRIGAVKRCMLTVLTWRLSSTMSFLKTTWTNTPQSWKIHPTKRMGTENPLVLWSSVYSYHLPLFSRSANLWRPKKFTKYNHPLYLIVSSSVYISIFALLNLSLLFQKKYGRSRLQKHPLVTSLLKYKWNKFGRFIFFGNLFLYLIFLAFLTAFSLVILSPVERTC